MSPDVWDRLVREKAYLRPLPVAPSLHQLARRRRDQAHNNTTTKETTPE